MTICGSYACNCGIISNSLAVTGSGAVGSPFQLETLQGQVVTSGTRPGSPTNGMGIYETDTQRLLVYDGTNWVIVGGNLPRFKIEAQTAQSIPNNTGTTIVLGTEVYDEGGFHTGTSGAITIPSGMGGDYAFSADAAWPANATSYRSLTLSIGSNAGAPTQNAQHRQGGNAMISTTLNGNSVAFEARVAAAATVTFVVQQATGGALDLNTATFSGHMIRHIPSLV